MTTKEQMELGMAINKEAIKVKGIISTYREKYYTSSWLKNGFIWDNVAISPSLSGSGAQMVPCEKDKRCS